MNNRSFQLIWQGPDGRTVIAAGQNESQAYCAAAKAECLLLNAPFAEKNPPTKAGRPGRSVTILEVVDDEEHEMWVRDHGAGHIKDLDSRVFASTASLSRWMGFGGTNQVGARLAVAANRGEDDVILRGLRIAYTKD